MITKPTKPMARKHTRYTTNYFMNVLKKTGGVGKLIA